MKLGGETEITAFAYTGSKAAEESKAFFTLKIFRRLNAILGEHIRAVTPPRWRELKAETCLPIHKVSYHFNENILLLTKRRGLGFCCAVWKRAKLFRKMQLILLVERYVEEIIRFLFGFWLKIVNITDVHSFFKTGFKITFNDRQLHYIINILRDYVTYCILFQRATFRSEVFLKSGQQ